MSTHTKLHVEWPEGSDPLLIEEVEAYLREKNLAGMHVSRPMAEPEAGSMSVGDYLPLIEIVLGSAVGAAAVKGLFDVIKKAIDLRMHKHSVHADLEKARLAAGQITFSIEKPGGEKLSLDFNAADLSERERFTAFIEQAWKSQA